MRGKGFVFLLKIHFIFCLVSAIQRKDLFPFGPHGGDLALQEGDDETSEVIKLKRPIVFYDTQFDNLYVGTNGIISFQDLPKETQYVDNGFPLDFPVIAPYLADIDTSNGRGRIYYREDHSSDILVRAGQEIRRAFPQSSIAPTTTFIATWENVAPYEEVTRSNPPSNRFNTFQAVLASDPSNTYAMFLYPEDGLQFFGTRPKRSHNVQIELPARVGLNRGAKEGAQWSREGSYYSITTNEQSVKNLYQTSNSGVRGLWIFHIGGTSSVNNIMQSNVRGEPSGEDTVVTLDSALSGPVIPDVLESYYAETGEPYYENEEFEYTPSIPTVPPRRVSDIPEDPPYPDAGIIPSYPEGYPETGIMSSYSESGAFPLHPERSQMVRTGLWNTDGFSVVESLPRNPSTVDQDRRVVSVEEEEELGTGVFTYSTDTRETCEKNQEQCSQHGYCGDYSSGFCCHCHSGYYGNGRECLQEGVTQRVNGKVNGKLMVGTSRMPVEFKNADLHAYVVVNDGRAFTAISQIPEVVGWAIQSLSIIGDLFGWLFALQQPGFKNGFTIAGAKFIRNIDLTFYPGNEQLNIIQIAQGLDEQNYLTVTTEIEGELPNIPAGAKIHMQPYDELYYRSSSAITSTAYRDYSVVSGNGEVQTLRYHLRQNITYYDCEHAPKAIPDPQNLTAERIFVLYDWSEQVVRYAMINQIGPVRVNSRPDTLNPCQHGSHSCDPRAQCFAVNDHDHICTCSQGYEGDGKVCTDIDECADGNSHGCGENTDCINVPGSYACECKQGYTIPEGENMCVSTNEHPKTVCEEQKERLQTASLRGPLVGIHVPQCDEEGNFRPMQCHSSTGYCWCVFENGREVPGTRTAPGTSQPRCGLPAAYQRPRSACEQQRERFETERIRHGSRPLIGLHVPQCDEEGNFRPMQCHSSTGHCWCVYENGQEVIGTRTPPGASQPHCGLPAINERPKTACEEQRERLQDQLNANGAESLVGLHILQCDDEGNFRPTQCHSSTGYCWCVDGRGQEIHGTRVTPGTRQPHCGLPEANERPKSACEQHRERVETEVSLRGHLIGLHVPQCDEEGNFRPMQCHSSTGYCWCVFENGQEVPGTRTAPGTSQPRCGLPVANERPKSTCEQHQERIEVEVSLRGPLVGLHVPQCDEEGNFRPMQCHSSTGYCWCVYENGQEVIGTRTAPGASQPRCGLPAATERPKSVCEQHRERIEAKLRQHGSLVRLHVPQCDEEGNFRPIQCHSSTRYCWCVYENGQEVPGTRTPPGTSQPRCGLPAANERPKSACEQHRERVEGEMSLRGTLVGLHVPQCDEEGNFRPMQCHSSTGYCWCVFENGQEVPGTRTAPGTSQPRCGPQAANKLPKSVCEQYRERVEAEMSLRGPLVGLHVPQCDEEGNFRPMQCHSSTGYCWCVDENGRVVPGTRTAPGAGQPHCGLQETTERPKTACEQHRERLQAILNLRGTLVGFHVPQCDDEGNFTPLQCQSSTGYCWCVYENGQEVLGTRTPPGADQPRCSLPAPTEPPKSACEQQRELIKTEMSQHGSQPLIGLHTPQCDEAGNFRPLQCHGSTGHCWCVDENGQEVLGSRTPPGNGQPHCGQIGSPRLTTVIGTEGLVVTRIGPVSEHPKTACEQHRERVEAEVSLRGPLVGLHVPQCDEEGNFRPMQCHSSTGYCWCVYENGQEVIGTRTAPGTGQPRCGLPETDERPKTLCEVQRERLQKELAANGPEPLVGLYIPQCDEEGNFSPMQCHSSTGYCWCVDQNGQEIQETRTPPGTSQPRCGLSENIEHPKNVCAKHLERLQAELSRHGSDPPVGVYIPQCDEEGNYKAMQCDNSAGYCWCVDENGQEVPGTRKGPGTDQPHCGAPALTVDPKPTCAAQRDQLQAELNLPRGRPAVGAYLPQCDAEGNFKPLQCHSSTGECWCVDELGQEIPGTRTLPGSDQAQCGLPEPLQRPQTVCERWRFSLLEHYDGRPADDQYIPWCTEFGDFRPLQCHGNSGYCWCVDKEGREIQGTRTEPGTPPACIPTIPPPTTHPTITSVVNAPSTGAFLLYAQGQHIGYLPLNGTRLNKDEAKSLLALHGSIIIGIDYDCRDKMVYWTDVAGRTINRVSLEPGAEPEIIINSGLISPEGLTIDYLHRRMFWTDSGLDKIETAAIDGSERRVLVDTDLVNPRAIVVDSLSGNLYWTDWNREAPKIETSRTDGTNRKILVKNDIGLPNGLTFDPFSSQLCWADAGTKDLECVFSNGTGRRVVQSGLNYPFSIVAYSNHFYYTDWRRDGIIVVPKDGSQITDIYLPDQRSHLYGITVAYPHCPHGRK
ncbi:nidogen-2 isoform X2 [Narcine bancroftii]|uniref:nidogen-2 isoform X2 n=1 Tax=Narcine bancroftii TaxID=1343680 RepID=UPI003831FF1F